MNYLNIKTTSTGLQLKIYLFSLNINETQVIFLSCDGLKDAKESFINSKLYKALGVVYLNKIKNWDLIKGHSKRANVIFLDSENQDTKSKHVGFGFQKKFVRSVKILFYIH